jgi:hypothetical protein
MVVDFGVFLSPEVTHTIGSRVWLRKPRNWVTIVFGLAIICMACMRI